MRPAELGQLRVQVQVTDGHVTVTVVAERPEVASLLSRESGSLTSALSEKGFAGAQVDVRQEGSESGAKGRTADDREKSGREARPGRAHGDERSVTPDPRSSVRIVHDGVLSVIA